MKSDIDATWLTRPSTLVAPELIGCTLVRQMPDGRIFRGMIVETEAYAPEDPAMHAYRSRTTRNQVMFEAAGKAYVYLIYGVYHCLNVVTDRDGIPSAVLLRALELAQVPTWVDHQEKLKPHRIAAGPGKLCRALKIDLTLNATPLEFGQALWLEHRQPEFQQQLEQGNLTLIQTTRIGLTKGVDLPWRWYLWNSLAVSKKG
ncbi:3-methyladenine DNA glycosylase [Nostoc piscinale CENA21]|uniref:Putative 3-methyladenine DNA glycosylase n=1 Tax=Nostoc piscinale CENA21 TaxID=224013 RepID=A0A0M5MH15_9NOSO|nr:DNA-3-methyladenine glycosylase [Nostoc piscinale]ALF54355.1 3-methyladenine DNA glycosylase [Nostoc piscinale CENA21]